MLSSLMSQAFSTATPPPGFSVGQSVQVWSNSAQQWITDGRVIEVSAQGVLVELSGGSQRKLIPTAQIHQHIAAISPGKSQVNTWRVAFSGNLGIRSMPHAFEAQIPGAFLQGGELFGVTEELQGVDGVLFLKLADGRGWVFNSWPGEGDVCVRAEQRAEHQLPQTTREQGFVTGDAVSVWSNSAQTWFDDGAVTAISGEGVTVNCNSGRFSKTIPHQQVSTLLKRAPSQVLDQASGQGNYQWNGVQYPSLEAVRSAMGGGYAPVPQPSDGGVRSAPCASYRPLATVCIPNPDARPLGTISYGPGTRSVGLDDEELDETRPLAQRAGASARGFSSLDDTRPLVTGAGVRLGGFPQPEPQIHRHPDQAEMLKLFKMKVMARGRLMWRTGARVARPAQAGEVVITRADGAPPSSTTVQDNQWVILRADTAGREEQLLHVSDFEAEWDLPSQLDSVIDGPGAAGLYAQGFKRYLPRADQFAWIYQVTDEDLQQLLPTRGFLGPNGAVHRLAPGDGLCLPAPEPRATSICRLPPTALAQWTVHPGSVWVLERCWEKALLRGRRMRRCRPGGGFALMAEEKDNPVWVYELTNADLAELFPTDAFVLPSGIVQPVRQGDYLVIPAPENPEDRAGEVRAIPPQALADYELWDAVAAA